MTLTDLDITKEARQKEHTFFNFICVKFKPGTEVMMPIILTVVAGTSRRGFLGQR